MTDFIASLSVLMAVMCCGVTALLLLPLMAITVPLSRSSTGESWSALIGKLASLYVIASLTVQLTKDHQHLHGPFSFWYPYISALLLFVFILEGAIDNRLEVIKEASKWTTYPQFVPELRFWKVVPCAVFPLFVFLLLFPPANIPYAYPWFNAAVKWMFNLPYIGPVLWWLAVIVGVRLLFGSLLFLLFRLFSLFAQSASRETANDL